MTLSPLRPLRCEAHECTSTIQPGAPKPPGDEPSDWTFYRVQHGWAVSWAINDGTGGRPPSSRMVVLCPLHHTL
jgi:hypothetical protein